MAKIVRLFNDNQESLVKHIEELLEAAKKGEIVNVLVAAETNNQKEVITGYCNLDVGERQYLLSHIQSDITMAIVAANIERILE